MGGIFLEVFRLFYRYSDHFFLEVFILLMFLHETDLKCTYNFPY